MVHSRGIDSSLLSPEFARLIGDGSGIVAEAALTNSERIEPAHFLGYLARTGGALLRVEFLEPRRVNPDRFCQHLYEAALDEDRIQGMPIAFNSETLSPRAQRLFAVFREEMARRRVDRGTEALFLIVLLQQCEQSVLNILQAIAGSREALQKFCAVLERRASGFTRKDVFDSETGAVMEQAFNISGRRVLHRLREETAGLGYRRASSLHLLYALVGIEKGVLQRALQNQAIDPVDEVQSFLLRELLRPGSRRILDFTLDRPSMYELVVRVLEAAGGEAQRDDGFIGEVHIARALLAARSGIVHNFLVSRKVNVDLLREYLAQDAQEIEEITARVRVPLGQIEAELRQRILGQDHAISQIIPWIKRLHFGFPRDRGPMAVFLFLGPSGTGKTQLAKELARTVYGSEDQLVMLEMGQFNAKESINIFVGAPPGYIGYGQGQLTNGLRDKPHSVVLFDEIEKAHDGVWGALMRFLDEGLISDPAGAVRDGRHCIIVLTSNLGADVLAQRPRTLTDDGPIIDTEIEQAIRDVVLPYLKRPEIYNRVDDKIVFRPLSNATYRTLVERQVLLECNRFEERHQIHITVLPEVMDWLTLRALEARLEGARCVPRIVNRFVVSPIIDLLIAHDDESVRDIVVGNQPDGQGIIAWQSQKDIS